MRKAVVYTTVYSCMHESSARQFSIQQETYCKIEKKTPLDPLKPVAEQPVNKYLML